MIKKIYSFFIGLFLIGCSTDRPVVTADYAIVPLPKEIRHNQNSSFILDNTTKIVYPSDNEKLQKTAKLLAEYIKNITGYKLDLTDKTINSNAIILTIDSIGDNPERYNLYVSDSVISIKGASEAGVFYGIQTLRKAIPAETTLDIRFPGVDITDYPAFPYRGALLDVSRHFFPVSFVKRYIDILAMCNINTFHWHLTDDQGWRIEIHEYPRLTEIGSYRDKTIIGRYTDEYDYNSYGDFYTQDEIKEIIKYAEERFITVIPEINIPGHTLAVLASYLELGCTGGPYKVGSEWGSFDDVLCAGNEEVFEFLDGIFSEISELFPSRYIHIGGDNCKKGRWMACPKCQTKIAELGLKDTKEYCIEEQLQYYFTSRIEKIVSSRGKKIIGWDEILEGGDGLNAAIMAWRDTEKGVNAANNGYDVIMTPKQFLYLDYYQSHDVDDEPFSFGWVTNLQETYSFNPIPDNLDKDKQKHILGAQVNVWTEYMPSGQNVEYMLLPRICALSETVWSNPNTKDYDDFVHRLYKLSKHFDKLGYENCKQAYEIQKVITVDTVMNEIDIQVSTFDFLPVYYTLTNKEPSIEAEMYTGENPIIIKENTIFKAAAYRDNVKTNVYTKDFVFHKACAKPITLEYQPDERYTLNGITTLVNGQLGTSSSYKSGLWTGFLGTNFEATIDLKEVMDISSVSINSFVNTRDRLFAPKSYSIFVSSDGNNFNKVYEESYEERKEHTNSIIVGLTANLEEILQARYIKVIAESIKTLPDWHERKGERAYLMIDEVVVH